ncbi:MAG: hypothetical protein LBS25_05235 [Candidatus Symbiothrix sp.]|jgi:hypothetical protein|nr:hypothetical protein [Candidatus Symbiothrix sp.]
MIRYAVFILLILMYLTKIAGQSAERVIQLRDVVVTAPDILVKRDTLVFRVQQYADAQDRTIADVLKKMPGIEVAQSGEIRYNGIPINKFYIEGNDLLEGRYGLASNNISYKDIQNVELMENHQPVRALQGIEYSEQAGLNLRLKQSAKLRWAGVINGGLGFSPMLYDASLFAMRIARKLQSVETVRVNNTGWNPASQNQVYSSDDLFGSPLAYNTVPDYITAGNYSTPIEDRRIRFNSSYLFNTTNSLKINDNYDAKAALMYVRDKLNLDHHSGTDYLDNSISPFYESEQLQILAHTISGQFTLKSNKPSMYLKENLSVDFSGNSAISDIAGLYNLGQTADKPIFEARNELQIVKRINNRILTVASSNSIVNKPHSLSVESEEKQYNQDVTATAFQSVTEVSYGWVFGRWQVRGRAGVDYSHNRIESRLTGIDVGDFPSANNSRLSVTNLYVRPEAVYENRRWWFNPHVSLNYYGCDFENHTAKAFGIVSPAVFARYKFSAQWEMSADARYVVNHPSQITFYQGIVMNDYRNISVGEPSYKLNYGSSAALSLRYRNPISSVFANVGATYERNQSPLMTSQLFLSDLIVSGYSPISNRSETYRVNGGISKGLVSGRLRIGLDAGYVEASAASLRNNDIVPHRLSVVSVAPSLKGTLLKWIAAEYSLSASRNELVIAGNSAESESINWKQKLTASLFPTKTIQAFVGAEHYHTKFNDNTADNLILFDVGTRWTVFGKVDINLSATNLLNDTRYRYTRHETLSKTVYQYRIRPRNAMLSVQIRI